ncbi:MAG: MoaD/ThiS family protein [Vampirovibrionales bacterium]|nr:MoaD/ThiS family protein [Cyanobacteria bacterium HKST-UBA05]
MTVETKTTITLEYFALLREERGSGKETIQTTAETVSELYSQLQAQHGFSLSPAVLKVAINGAFAPWESPVREQDTIVFIPPVAGG